MSEAAPGALAQLLSRAGRSPVVVLAALGSLVAAACHAYVTPVHFEGSVGQGLFMAALALAQLAWGVAFLWRPRAGTYVAGIALALASLGVWLLAVLVRAPFAREAEPVDGIATLTKLAEAATLLALLLVPVVHARGADVVTSRALPAVALALLLGLAGGGGAYGAGLVGEKVFPGWVAEEGHSHGGGMEEDDGHAHDEGEGAHAHAPEPVVIALDPAGAQAAGAFVLEEPGASLALAIEVESAGPGAWFFTGAGGSGDLVVELRPPEGDAIRVRLAGTAGQAGVDPVARASLSFEETIDAPPAGEWEVVVLGQGSNARVEVRPLLAAMG